MPNIRVRKETGLLYFDFQYLKVRCREQSLLEDSKPNRKKMQKVLDEILGKIKSHTFPIETTFQAANSCWLLNCWKTDRLQNQCQ